ncbi:MAG: long-chain fatty acid--CoA ligase [Solirubrobacterales bacterium]|nr:long-chain fatty acid--CoA ligase [Solirubrobacterales bacterium]
MLIDVLRAGAAAEPARPAVIAAGRSVSYADLVAQAQSVARGLRERGVTRFGCAVQDPIGVIVLLAASAASGSEACVYPRALEPDAVTALAQRLGHDLVVTDAGVRLDGVQATTADALERTGGELPTPEATQVLILTTGTTGAPKGVRHDWARLVRSVRAHEDDMGGRWLMAYNLNQFAAFQVLLHAFVHRSSIVVPASTHAHDAMEAMVQEQVTHISATPTFWRLLVGGMNTDRAQDLALRQITLGGEAAPGTLIERLKQTFPTARVSHVYAGTEFGSVVSVRDGLSGLPLSVLDRGEDADAHFRVVDGELQVRSRNAMLGYHGGGEPDQWHATGDLVQERDGRLHFVGRTVEIINVAGAKIHPLPLEEIISTVPGVVVAAVYGKPNAVTGNIVAVDVVSLPDADQKAIQDAIHKACAGLPAPGRPRRIRFVDALEVRGQKIVRLQPEVEA